MKLSNRSAHPNYGIDASILVWGFALTGFTGCVLTVALIFGSKVGLPPWTRFGILPAISMGISFLPTATVMLWGSMVGKLRLRDKVIASMPWCGEERVLDVGCGHGLMLIGAAKRLRNGKAVGIDLWQSADQAGNSPEATWQNAELENVSDRVELIDGDARALPFADDYFDVVLSSWALHNIYDRSGRDTAIQEIIRVLKPGGRLVIVDIRHTAEYAEAISSDVIASPRIATLNAFGSVGRWSISQARSASTMASLWRAAAMEQLSHQFSRAGASRGNARFRRIDRENQSLSSPMVSSCQTPSLVIGSLQLGQNPDRLKDATTINW